jgi:hypothetical protein
MSEIVGPDTPRPGSASVPPSPPADNDAQWYPDPTGRFEFRSWDGTAWTAQVRTNGFLSVDPEPVVTLPASATNQLPPRVRRHRRPWIIGIGVVVIVAAAAVIVTVSTNTVLTDHLLTVDFASGSGRFSTGTTPDYSYDIFNGLYRIRKLTSNPDSGVSAAGFARTAYAVDISADIVYVSGDGPFGVGCFNSGDQGYALLASPNGGVALLRSDKVSGAKNGVIATNDSVDIPAANIQLKLSCDDSLTGSSVSLKGYLNGQEVVSGTDSHGLNGFDQGTLELIAPSAGSEIRVASVNAVVPTS